MKHVLCAVSDRASGAYVRPFAAPTIAFAVRGFMDACKSEKQMMDHPGDYELHYLADWDDVTGDFSVDKSQERIIARATSFVIKGE
jgi:hypothetical protein